MRRSVIALFLYLGVALFFAIYALAIFGGASVLTATTRALTGLIAMGVLGLLAGAACKPSKRSGEAVETEQDEQVEQVQP